MLERIRRSLSFANVISVAALFVALGGSAYAVTQLDKNSVKSKHIVDGQVRSPDVEDNGLTGVDVDESTLGSVPFAEEANTANSALSAGNADTLDSKDASEFSEKGSESWTPLQYGNTLNGQPTGLLCSWTNYGNGFNPGAYFRDDEGTVHLRGLVKAVDGSNGSCGAAQPPFDHAILGWDQDPNGAPLKGLPAGYRPANREVFSVISNNAAGRVDVTPQGNLLSEPGFPTFVNAKNWLSLDGLSFRCAPAGENGCP